MTDDTGRAVLAVDPREPLRVMDALAGVMESNRDAQGLPSVPAVFPGSPEHLRSVNGRVPVGVALVVRTSGSTGAPKLVGLSTAALAAGSKAALEALGGAGQWLLALPAAPIAGVNVLARSIVAGTVPVPLPPGPFTAGAFTTAAASLTASRRYVSLVPTQLHRLMADTAARETLGSFDAVLVGGAATPPALRERALGAGIRLVRSYGSSETCGGCVYDGRPLPGVAVHIEDGEVRIAGPVLAEGYLDDAALAAARFPVHEGRRWYRTGDLGTMTGGALEITGRVDDLIVSGGVNVSLAAIESVLHGLPYLADAVVLAEPHEEWGQVPVVVTTAEASLAPVREAVEAALGAPAAPARIVRVAAMPMLASGKPDRVALREVVAAAR